MIGDVFTDPLDAREFDDTQAVQRLMEREGLTAEDDLGDVCFVHNGHV